MASSIHAHTVAFCRKCGTPLTQETRREFNNIPYCEPCLETVQTAPPERPAADKEAADTGWKQPKSASGTFPRAAAPGRYAPPPPANGTVSPLLAGILGFIPGVGAVYNGQFAKGVLHVVVFGLLISIVASDGTGDLRPLFVFLIILTAIYMPIEAYRTARAIERGEPVEEFSGMLSVFGRKRPSPAGGVLLIVLGVVFLLNTLGYWRLSDLVHYWPVLLIALGVFMLYRSVSAQAQHDDRIAYGGGQGPLGGGGFRAEPDPVVLVPPQSEERRATDDLA